MIRNNRLFASILTAAFYCYSTVAAVVFQKFVLPSFPGYHGAYGLINADSLFFHLTAAKLAETIRIHGWSHWVIKPAEGATGNVSILAALYALFGDYPMLILPVNAALHSLGGLFMFLIGRQLWPGKVGTYSGLIAASIFVMFPSSLNWYAQIHKDGFAILGILIMCYAWIKGVDLPSKKQAMLWIVLGTMIGTALVAFVRPYNIKLITMSGTILSVAMMFYTLVRGKFHHFLYVAGTLCVFLVVFLGINSFTPKLQPVVHREELLQLFKSQGIDWSWTKSEVVLASLDELFENTTLIRLTNVYHGRLARARSVIDEGARPENFWSALSYVPRAALVATFAPFPTMWTGNRSIIQLVSVGETVIWYMCFPGVIMAFWYRRSIKTYLLALNSLVFLTILGYANPNMGTLYRFRYVYLLILILIGVSGWVEFFHRRMKVKDTDTGHCAEGPDSEESRESRIGMSIAGSRSSLMTAGITVIVFTLLSNMFLVVRDVALARWFGLSNELDAFFIAMIAPMFVVTVLSIPIGTVVIPPLIAAFEQGRDEAQRLITLASTLILCVMTALTVVLYLSGRFYLPVLGWGFSAQKIAEAHRLLLIALPILFFSGFVILGNSVLNARQRFAAPALAQGVVPVIAIVFLFVAARRIGIDAMAYGMLAGQLINLYIVHHYVKKEGLRMFPEWRPAFIGGVIKRSAIEVRSLSAQYAPLVLSALFISLALPVNNTMAASLAPGSVSAFGLGTKFIVFFTGLIGTGISTVMLPHFSAYFAKNRIMDVRKELSFFLLLSTIIPIPVTIVIYLITGPMITVIFKGGLFTVNDIGVVTKIMQYGIIQLPFFCTNMLLVKFANARRRNTLIMVTSLFSLGVNVALNFALMGTLGVAGVALAFSLSVALGTALFVAVGQRLRDIGQTDAVFISLIWTLYLIVILFCCFGNAPGIVITSIYLSVITVLYFMSFMRGTATGQPEVA